jgi:transcriptional regulator with GAF, ATPase, and Fis domain
MNRHEEVLLNVWREACRHIEVQEAIDRIVEALAPAMPLGWLALRVLDSVRGEIETVAIGTSAGGQPPGESRTSLASDQLGPLLEWCRGAAVAHGVAEALPPAVAAVVPHDARGELIVGPLPLRGERFGMAIFAAATGKRFGAADVGLANDLLEAFSVALDNDQRVREIAARREAAEAEKQSLLARLGRKQLGDTIIGVDSGLRPVLERVELVARSDVPVLIFGETGSGKELVARTIHNRSRCADGPFIRVNCGAIPPELIDSQLFGHERGAFTGATETRKGWFERADGGTLLLDEIGELPAAAQVRLLRVVQDGWLERVGGHHPINVSVRIVAATHRDLAAMAAEGQFRQDLWYRLAVFPIVLPPLRERRSDIEAMARHFAERAAVRFGLTPVMPTADDLRLLGAYSWPGNVRELAAVIDRAAILGDGRRLEVSTALGVSSLAPAIGPDAAALSAPPTAGALCIATLDDAMRRHIETALRACGGRVEGPRGAARLLSINPHTLRGKMRKLKIDWQAFRDS